MQGTYLKTIAEPSSNSLKPTCLLQKKFRPQRLLTATISSRVSTPKRSSTRKPELNVYRMETQAILAGSYIEKAKDEDYSEESVNDYRDTWGNIWAD